MKVGRLLALPVGLVMGLLGFNTETWMAANLGLALMDEEKRARQDAALMVEQEAINPRWEELTDRQNAIADRSEALIHQVMGEAAYKRRATPQEVEMMKTISSQWHPSEKEENAELERLAKQLRKEQDALHRKMRAAGWR